MADASLAISSDAHTTRSSASASMYAAASPPKRALRGYCPITAAPSWRRPTVFVRITDRIRRRAPASGAVPYIWAVPSFEVAPTMSSAACVLPEAYASRGVDAVGSTRPSTK